MNDTYVVLEGRLLIQLQVRRVIYMVNVVLLVFGIFIAEYKG